MIRSMRNLLILSAAMLPFCALAAAQDVVPVIYLSANEAAQAKQFLESFVNAKGRNSRALTAWRLFHETYQAQHPELPRLKFAADFRVAVAWRASSEPSSDGEAATIELSAQERQHAAALYQEMTESKRALDEAEKRWQDFWHELVVNHVTASREGGVPVTLSNGQTGSIPNPWTNGVFLTPDFRIAIPH
jgi:hypothetical protein